MLEFLNSSEHYIKEGNSDAPLLNSKGPGDEGKGLGDKGGVLSQMHLTSTVSCKIYGTSAQGIFIAL